MKNKLLERLIDKIAEKTAEKLADHIIKKEFPDAPMSPENTPIPGTIPHWWDGIAVAYGCRIPGSAEPIYGNTCNTSDAVTSAGEKLN